MTSSRSRNVDKNPLICKALSGIWGHAPNVKSAMVTVLTCLILFGAFLADSKPVEAESSPFAAKVRITPDGVVEGTDKISQNGNVYTLTGDISGSVEDGQIFISIERDGLILEGADRTIKGTGTGIAISVRGRKDVTIKNTKIIDFGTGIELRATDFETNSTASNNQILDNYMETKYWGIDLNTVNGIVSGNEIVSKSSVYGVNFHCNNTVFSNNVFTNGGLIVFGPCFHNVVSGNTINGRPLVYLEKQKDQTIDGAGQVFLTECSNLTVRNVQTNLNLRMTIELFGTNYTKITNCKGNLILRNSHSNSISNNQLVDVSSPATYGSSAVTLSGSPNNTVANNLITASGSGYGVTIAGSSYNNVYGNNISVTGHAGIKIESTSEFQAPPEFNYIYDNRISCTEYGLSFQTGARRNTVFKNVLTACEIAVSLLSGYENTFIGNNISGSTKYAVYFSISDNNSFYHNSFWNNPTPAYENHEVYWWAFQNNTYYSENNTWDNGREGNYWDDYSGSDTNGDGIGETPYNVYENFSDHYPLTAPFDTATVTVDFVQWVPSSSYEEPQPADELQIIVLSPENTTYSIASVPLDLMVSGPVIWLGYSLDFQSNVTLAGNTTLADLSPGTHCITVYGYSAQGVAEVPETVFFTVSATESIPTATIAAFAVASASAVVAGSAVVYLKKHKRAKKISSAR